VIPLDSVSKLISIQFCSGIGSKVVRIKRVSSVVAVIARREEILNDAAGELEALVYTRKYPAASCMRAVCERAQVTVPRRDVKPLIRRMFLFLPFHGFLLQSPCLFYLLFYFRFPSDHALLRISDTWSSAIVVSLPVYIYVLTVMYV